MTTFVLPGDAIPLPADPVDPSTSQSITFGPGIGASTLKTGSEVISVATKMGPVHNNAKRRKTKDGPTEVNRLWVEVQSKRVGRLRTVHDEIQGLHRLARGAYSMYQHQARMSSESSYRSTQKVSESISAPLSSPNWDSLRSRERARRRNRD